MTDIKRWSPTGVVDGGLQDQHGTAVWYRDLPRWNRVPMQSCGMDVTEPTLWTNDTEQAGVCYPDDVLEPGDFYITLAELRRLPGAER